MEREELHARIRRLIFTSGALSEAFSRGEFRSVFKGRGVDFEALREYDDGEDARLIDWNVTVRLARPYIRLYHEDRSLTLFLLIDLSPSMEMGSGDFSKRDMAVLSASLLAYAAQFRGMPVGALLFTGQALRYFQPRQGKVHALALIEAAVDARLSLEGAPSSHVLPNTGGADLPSALDAAGRLLKRRSLIIAASDFQVEGLKDGMARLSRRHDLVALRVTDRLDLELPSRGAFALRDAEGGERRIFALGSAGLRRQWREKGEAERLACKEVCAKARIPLLEIDTRGDPARSLLEFFGRRKKA